MDQFVAAVEDSHDLNLGQAEAAVQLQPVDQASHVTRAKTVVDIHHCDVAGAAVEHPEEGGQAVEAGAITYAGRHRDYGTGHQTTDDARQGTPSIPAQTTTTRAAVSRVLLSSSRWIPATPTS